MCRAKPFPYYVGLMLLLILQIQLTCASANIYNQTCAPSSCGEVTNISYPFRLKDHDPENCGNPKYELACENNRTVLTLFSAKYFVKSIDYRNFTIRLVDSGIQDGNCSSIPLHSLSVFNFTSYYDYDYGGDPYEVRSEYKDTESLPDHVTYLNCSNPVRDDPLYVDTSPCINHNSTGGHLYAIAGRLSAGRLKLDCHVKLIAMTSLSTLNDHQTKQKLSYVQIHKSLIYGFNLSWMKNGPCRDLNCPNNQSCYFNGTTLGCSSLFYHFAAYCNSPLGFVVICDHLSKPRIFVEDIILGIAKDSSSQLFFPIWIYNQLVEEREIGIMDEVTNEEKNNVKKMFLVALWCIQLKPTDRPSMKKVIEMLEGNIENIEMPPKPLLYPNEIIQGDLDVESDETLSDTSATFSSYIEESIEPLLINSS